MRKKIFRGCGTALATPFGKDGKVDYEAYGRMVQRQIEGGVDFLVPLGTTAETPCLEDDEKIELLKITRSKAGKMPVLVGCGTNSLTKTVANIKMLEPYGPDAFLVVVPFYNKPVQEGMYEYFKAVAESTDKPIVLYNVPGRTGANMLAETTLRLAEIPNIVAVKEASGKLDQIKEIIDNAPEGFSVLSGNDDQAYDIIKAGGDGLISVAVNIAPAQVSEFVHVSLSGKLEEGKSLADKLEPLFTGCFVESNPIPVKGGLSLLGLCENILRLPLTPATDKTLEVMRAVIKDLGL